MHVRKRRPWIPIALIALPILLLLVLFFYLPQAPKATAPPTNAMVPNQPTGGALQITQMQMTRHAQGGPNSVNIEGNILNNGDQSVIGATVEATFRDQSNQPIARMAAPIMAVEGGVTKAFVDNPLAPQANREFRLTFTSVPQEWNGQEPELRIAAVAGTTPTNNQTAPNTNE